MIWPLSQNPDHNGTNFFDWCLLSQVNELWRKSVFTFPCAFMQPRPAPVDCFHSFLRHLLRLKVYFSLWLHRQLKCCLSVDSTLMRIAIKLIAHQAEAQASRLHFPLLGNFNLVLIERMSCSAVWETNYSFSPRYPWRARSRCKALCVYFFNNNSSLLEAHRSWDMLAEVGLPVWKGSVDFGNWASYSPHLPPRNALSDTFYRNFRFVSPRAYDTE